MKLYLTKIEATTKELEKMEEKKCRICNCYLYDKPLLSYVGMPAAAQNFPDEHTVVNDHAHDLDVYQCASCGLVQLINDPVSYYKDVIRAAAFSSEMHDFRLKQLKAWVKQYELTNRNIIEVGSGYGEYLSLLKAAGANAFGIEHSTDAVSSCQRNHLQVYQGYFGDSQAKNIPQDFDGFMCLNFMEHWPDPNASLREINQHLANGAIGLIEVPNFDMILEKGLFSEFICDHLLYFTEDTFRFTLQQNGFEVLACQSVWHDYIISAVVRKRTPTNLDFFDQFRQSISIALNEFVDGFGARKVAIWGAGHQSLAIIALANLADKIAYVVDSATFKQGKYTPASHLQIVAPSHLTQVPVDAVIIMAASYSDEVARIIRDEYSPNIKVAILRDDGLEEVD